MVEIKRSTYSVIVYDEEQLRGIVFPANQTIEVEQFVKEVGEIAASDEIRAGTCLHPLVFDPEYKEHYQAMSEFLESKEGAQVLADDKQAEELYDFYFSHSMPTVGPDGVDYIYMGKDYVGIKVTIM